MVNESMEQLLAEQDNSYQEIYKGTVVEGTVILEKDDAFYIDLQYKTDGYLPKSEVFDDEDIHVGDKVRLFVIKVDKNNGDIVLSKKRVDEISAWDDIEVGKIVTVKGLEVNSKGLIVSYKGNVRGFIPLSQIELKYVGEDVARTYLSKEFEAEVYVLKDLQEILNKAIIVNENRINANYQSFVDFIKAKLKYLLNDNKVGKLAQQALSYYQKMS